MALILSILVAFILSYMYAEMHAYMHAYMHTHRHAYMRTHRHAHIHTLVMLVVQFQPERSNQNYQNRKRKKLFIIFLGGL